MPRSRPDRVGLLISRSRKNRGSRSPPGCQGTATSGPRGACAVSQTPKPKQVPTDDDDDGLRNPSADRRSKAKQKAKQSGATKARNDSLPEETNPGIADRNEPRRLDANTQTDGVGFEPTNDFRRCRFSRPVHSTALPPIQTAAVSPRPRTSVARACRRSCQRRSLASLPPPSAGGPDPPPGIPPASVPQGSPLTKRPIWPKTVVLTPESRVDFPARGTPCPRRPLRDRTPTPHEHPTGPAISWAASATG